ncbi:MAG: hypothetical protein ACFFDT_04175 [Candidatus Hodarchaeota archaeon]
MAFKRKAAVSVGPEGSPGLRFSDLRMTFDIKKTLKESTNKGRISIFNLSDASVNKVFKVGNKIIVEAGYEDEKVRSIFFGEIKRVIDTKTGIDRETAVEAYDGAKSYQNKNISISFKEGTLISTVLNKLVDEFDLPLGNVITGITGQYANGYSFIGKIKTALTEVCDYAGKKWSIQNEQLFILGDNNFVDRTGLLLSKDTGLIGYPELLDDAKEEEDSEVPPPKRWKIKSLLFGELVPGYLVKVQSNSCNGAFQIESTNFVGDTHGDDWSATCEVKAL